MKVKTVGGKTKSKELKTENGVKDTYQEVFAEKIFSFLQKFQNKEKKEEKQAELDKFVKGLPSNPRSPVWRIKGKALSSSYENLLHDTLCCRSGCAS